MFSRRANQQMFAISIFLLVALSNNLSPISATDYPPGYVNFNDCIHAYFGEGTYSEVIPDHEDPAKGNLVAPQVIASESGCFTADNPTANLTVQFSTNDDFFKSIKLNFTMRREQSSFWEVERVCIEVEPVQTSVFDKSYEMVINDMWAGDVFSWSCSGFELQSRPVPPKPGVPRLPPQYTLKFKQFQLQPFNQQDVVFAPSFDCSVWLTLPMIMGLILIILVVVTVLIVICLLIELGAQTKDLKFSKQGGMLMNQAQLENTKG